MTRVMFSFDCEDYTNPIADDAIKDLAEILTAHKIRGCFNFVGELAKQLEVRNRTDIIDGLADHEINAHSWRHTWHPTVVEYADQSNWQKGYDRFLQDECYSLNLIKKIFNREKIYAAVPPGNSITSQSLYVYHDLGVPMCNGSLFKDTLGKPIWYCNQLNLENNLYLDDILLNEGADAFIKRADFLLDYDQVVICMHPNMAYYTEFWDKLNCEKRNLVPFGMWKFPQKRSNQDIRNFMKGFEKVVNYFNTTPGFLMVTNREVWQQYNTPRKPITVERLRKMLHKIEERFFFVKEEGDTFSLSDLYEACVFFAAGGIGAFTPKGIRGLLEEPVNTAELRHVPATLIHHSAKKQREIRHIPNKLSIGEEDIGPGSFMFAVRDFLDGQEICSLPPVAQMPNTSDFYNFDQFKLKGTWMHSADFLDEYTTKRLRLQAWTIRA